MLGTPAGGAMPSPRKPCLRMTIAIPPDGDLTWEFHKAKPEPPPPAPKLAVAASVPTDEAAVAEPEVPPEKKPAPPAFEHPNAKSRFQEMITGMERKYATARPMQPLAKRQGGRAGGPSKKKKKGAAAAAAGGDGAAPVPGAADAAAASGTSDAAAPASAAGEGGASGEGGPSGAKDDEMGGDEMGGGEAAGEEDADDDDDGSVSSRESWYDMEDDFIDDSELIEEMNDGEDDDDDDEEGTAAGGAAAAAGGTSAAGGGVADDAPAAAAAPPATAATKGPRVKASGFFISRGDVQSAEQQEAARAREAERASAWAQPPPARKRTANPAANPKAAKPLSSAPPIPTGPWSAAAAQAANTSGVVTNASTSTGPKAAATGAPSAPAAQRTDCTVWIALCALANMLGVRPSEAGVADGDDARVTAMLTEASKRHRIGVKEIKLTVERHLNVKLALADSWFRFARSLSTKISAAQAHRLSQDLPLSTLLAAANVAQPPAAPSAPAQLKPVAAPAAQPGAALAPAAALPPPQLAATSAVPPLAVPTLPLPATSSGPPTLMPDGSMGPTAAVAACVPGIASGALSGMAVPFECPPSHATAASIPTALPMTAANPSASQPGVPPMPQPGVPPTARPMPLPSTGLMPTLTATTLAAASSASVGPPSAAPVAAVQMPPPSVAATPRLNTTGAQLLLAPSLGPVGAGCGNELSQMSVASSLPDDSGNAATENAAADGGGGGSTSLWLSLTPVPPAEADALAATASTRLASAVNELRQQVEADPKFAPLLTSTADAPGAGGKKKQVRFTGKIISALGCLVRWAQLGAFARAAGPSGGAGATSPGAINGGASLSVGIDGTVLPSCWITKSLLASVRQVLPFLNDSELRTRLVNIGKNAAAPEQAELLRGRVRTVLLPVLEAAIRESISKQARVHEAAKADAKRENKARAEQLAASEPDALVGEKVDVFREGKWRTWKVASRAEDGVGTHVVVEVSGANKKEETLTMNGEGACKWRRHDEPLPTPKYSWDNAVDAALRAVSAAQMAACDREHEYGKYSLPVEAAGRSTAHLCTHESWTNDRFEHPEMLGLYAAVTRAFTAAAGNAKWMKDKSVRDHAHKLLQAARDAAAAKGEAGAPPPPSPQPMEQAPSPQPPGQPTSPAVDGA